MSLKSQKVSFSFVLSPDKNSRLIELDGKTESRVYTLKT